MALLICAVLFLVGAAVSCWAIFWPINREEVNNMPPSRRDSHTP
ncbi:hypothetical protein [Streptomyces asiaticus]